MHHNGAWIKYALGVCNCEKGNFNSAANKTNAHALLLKRLQMMWLVLHHLIGCKIEKG